MITKFILTFTLVALAYARYPLPNDDKQKEELGVDKKAVTDFENKWCDLYKTKDLKSLEAMYADPFYYAEHTKLFTSKKDYIKDLEAFLEARKGHTCKQEIVSISGCDSEVVVVGRWFNYDSKGKQVEEQFFVDVLRKNEKGEYQLFVETTHQVGNFVKVPQIVEPVAQKPDDKLTQKPDDKLTQKPDDKLTQKLDDKLTQKPDKKKTVENVPQKFIVVTRKPVEVSKSPEVKQTTEVLPSTEKPEKEDFEYGVDDEHHSSTEKPEENVADLDE